MVSSCKNQSGKAYRNAYWISTAFLSLTDYHRLFYSHRYACFLKQEIGPENLSAFNPNDVYNFGRSVVFDNPGNILTGAIVNAEGAVCGGPNGRPNLDRRSFLMLKAILGLLVVYHDGILPVIIREKAVSLGIMD